MNNPKQNFFLTNNNQKIHYKFINNKSQTTIIFLHGLMSDIKRIVINSVRTAEQKFN